MRVRYSPGESSVLALLREDFGRSSADLAKLHYCGDGPFNGQRVVVGLLSSLARKVVLNGEPFRVRRSPRRGPHPVYFWREPMGSPQRSLAGQMNGTFLPAPGSPKKSHGTP